MKKFFLIALMASLGFPMVQAQRNFASKAEVQRALAGSRHTDNPVTAQTPLQFKASFNDPIPEGMALVTLAVGEVWSDGSGYQMLLDADANTYGTVFPTSGPLTSGGDADASVYAEFEYKIPENADGACNTANMVVNNSVSILIPAGVYDYVITNPSPGDRVWIASPFGSIGGRNDDFTFEAGKSYTFTVYMGDNGNDATDLTVTGDSAMPTTPTDVAVEAATTTATVTWSDYDDTNWNLRYRVFNPDADPDAVAFFWDFEDGMGDWESIDADGDGYDWYLNDPLANGYDPGDGVVLFGTRSMTSESYSNTTGEVLHPDNWLVSPQVTLDGQLSFWAAGQSANWYSEVFAVYATTGDPDDLDSYVKISDDITATRPIKEYTFDLSSFAGQQGYVAFRHYNVSDMFRLNIDNVSIGTSNSPAPWITVSDLTDRNYTIENLAPGTTYELQVQAVNQNGASDWTETTMFTTNNDQAITEVYINGYESPVEGENSQDHLNLSVPEGANYHIYLTSWSPEWWDNDVDDEFFGTFVGGTKYSIGMSIEANEGHYFAENCKFYVNGSQSLVDNDYTGVDEDMNTFAYVWTVPEVAGSEVETYVITEVYVNGYESPVAGEDSQAHLNITVPADANYHIYADHWSPEWWDNDADDDFFGIFVDGTYYSVGMTIEANEGYRFASNCKFYVNGTEAIVDYDFSGVDDENDTYAYVWTIPEAAGPAPVNYEISEVYVYGYESPVAGEDSQTHLNIIVPEDANYSILANTWSPEWWDNDADDDFFGIFVEDTYYSVGMTLEANEGYHFAEDCKFYVNGSEELVDYDFTYVESEDGNIYAYLWTIPEAAKAPVVPTEQTGAPTFHGYTEDGIHGYFVEIIPTESSVIYYRVQYPDGTWSEWEVYEDILSFTGDGKYRVEAYAVASGKLPSEQIAYEFVVTTTGVEELTAGKQIAGVRYYNMAGQEMQEANGMTIVVTTYTDGTTSAVKVVK